MEEELRKIALNLRDWAKQYKKDYVTIVAMNNKARANVDTQDRDYKKLDISISEDEINENQLKQELDDMRHKYDDLKDDYEDSARLNDILGNTIIEIRKAVVKYRGCNQVNIEKEINKILADLTVELVSSK